MCVGGGVKLLKRNSLAQQKGVFFKSFRERCVFGVQRLFCVEQQQHNSPLYSTTALQLQNSLQATIQLKTLPLYYFLTTHTPLTHTLSKYT